MTKTIEIRLDDARAVMFEELVETFGEDVIHSECDQHITRVLTELYDRRNELEPQTDIVNDDQN